ncbi:endonuclease NucS domain-containing protein [Leptolyngbya sp. FACHB-261]|uniref:endonuclease NucS domain-containing protein n=1 Tax=Leptolyngbya sp. FACHB-261 TaxID=2692806 RepID=UPI0016820F05|nr:endonuclease NucS domain-containing protein [Leptolyngbya sp. FACHB-261]MBD2105325.1 DUF91 domain-containing protein [Leptolyngbya sp. FACHB-261]
MNHDLPNATGVRFFFESEEALEDFVWENLGEILNLNPIKRQHFTDKQVCDLLAVNENQQLTIIELKNSEDRYIVQQLTRYYDALLEERPFSEKIDYNRSIRLVAISPCFHKHNFVDRKHHALPFEFFSFEITRIDDGLYFELKNVDNGQVIKVRIPGQLEGSKVFSTVSEPIPNLKAPHPKPLQKFLEEISKEEQEKILYIRDKMLSFNEQMKEITEGTTILYGLKKGQNDIYRSSICGELFTRNFKDWSEKGLALWLPYPKLTGGGMSFCKPLVKNTVRIKVETSDWENIIRLSIIKSRRHWGAVNSHTPQEYMRIHTALTGSTKAISTLNDLLEVTLKNWQEEISSNNKPLMKKI